MEDCAPAPGRVTAIRAASLDATAVVHGRLEPGPLTLGLVIEGIPIGDLPAGARLRIGDTVIVELDVRHAGPAAEGAGVLEAGEADTVAAAVVEGGSVRPGDPVILDAVAIPLTDVLDLHSFRPEDMPKVVAEYLGEARRAGFGEVRIVHGRGRGVQRAVVRRLLAETPGVAGFSDAPPTRGGWGATLVRLRPGGAAPAE